MTITRHEKERLAKRIVSQYTQGGNAITQTFRLFVKFLVETNSSSIVLILKMKVAMTEI